MILKSLIEDGQLALPDGRRPASSGVEKTLLSKPWHTTHLEIQKSSVMHATRRTGLGTALQEEELQGE